MHLNQPFADGETQPGAAHFSGERSIDLGEGLEQLPLIFSRDAGAGISDTYNNFKPAFGVGLYS